MMQKLATGIYKPNKNKAYTLIEILVVVVILAIIAGIAVLSFSDFGKSDEQKAELDKFKQQIEYLTQKAVSTNSTYGVLVTANDYRFYHYELDQNSIKGQWVLIKDDDKLKSGIWPETLNAEIHIQSEDFTENMIVINNNGSITPFILNFLYKDKNKFQLEGFDDGRLVLN